LGLDTVTDGIETTEYTEIQCTWLSIGTPRSGRMISAAIVAAMTNFEYTSPTVSIQRRSCGLDAYHETRGR